MNDRIAYYLITGTIEPADSCTGLRYSGSVRVDFQEPIGPTHSRVHLRDNRVTIRVDADASLPVQMIFNNTRSAIEVLVDAIGFGDGHGRAFHIASGRNLVTGQDYTWHSAVVELDDAWEHHRLGLEELLEAARISQRLGDALGDYRRAIREPWDAGFYCYRGIETIRRHWQPADSRRSGEAWLAMRTALRLGRSFFDRVKEEADLQRHGGRRSLTPDDHADLLADTHIVIERFARLLLADATQLDIEETAKGGVARLTHG